MKIKEICAEERPREKLLAKGASSLGNSELLAILIGSGTQKENVIEVANRLLSTADGKLSEIAKMTLTEMSSLGGIGPNKYASIAAALELGRRSLLEDSGIEKVSVRDAESIYRLMLPALKGLDHEELWIIFLNRANYIIGKEMLSRGGTDSTVVDCKIVLRMALDKRASGIIMVHNHPSGSPRPGLHDIKATESMKKAASTFDIALLDHIIVCDDCFFTFASNEVKRL